MTMKTLRACAAAGLIGLGALSLSAPAFAGGYHGHYHDGGAWVGAGIAGLAAGAILGSALASPPPPPPPDYYYGPAYASYAPPPWTPAWYQYCSSRFATFNPRTGYFIGYDGNPYFCH
jgi:BA14K-like protein